MKYSFKELKKINDFKIVELTKNNGNKDTNKEEMKIQLAINEILKDDYCFFKMKMDLAIDILTKLIEKDNIKETYLELINAQNFKKYNNSSSMS